jgi:hypothetical protein
MEKSPKDVNIAGEMRDTAYVAIGMKICLTIDVS